MKQKQTFLYKIIIKYISFAWFVGYIVYHLMPVNSDIIWPVVSIAGFYYKGTPYVRDTCYQDTWKIYQ